MMPTRDFSAFQERVWSDPALQTELYSLRDLPEFLAHLLELGQQEGYAFSEDDLQNALRASRMAWIERGIR